MLLEEDSPESRGERQIRLIFAPLGLICFFNRANFGQRAYSHCWILSSMIDARWIISLGGLLTFATNLFNVLRRRGGEVKFNYEALPGVPDPTSFADVLLKVFSFHVSTENGTMSANSLAQITDLNDRQIAAFVNEGKIMVEVVLLCSRPVKGWFEEYIPFGDEHDLGVISRVLMLKVPKQQATIHFPPPLDTPQGLRNYIAGLSDTQLGIFGEALYTNVLRRAAHV